MNIVVEGGGIKVISAIGCLKYFEQHDIIFKKFAGSSMGALIVFFMVIGLDSKELEKILLETNIANWVTDSLNISLPYNLVRHYGLHSGKNFTTQLNVLLAKKGFEKDITFAKLYEKTKKELVITGTCVNKRDTEYFNRFTTANMSVVLAIRISISLPIYFYPVEMNGCLYVDGGVLNNFPLYYFENEHYKLKCSHRTLNEIHENHENSENLDKIKTDKVITVGIKMIEENEKPDDILFHGTDKINNVTEFAMSIINGVSTKLEASIIKPGFWNSVIQVHVPVIDIMTFTLTPELLKLLINAGYNGTKLFYEK